MLKMACDCKNDEEKAIFRTFFIEIFRSLDNYAFLCAKKNKLNIK